MEGKEEEGVPTPEKKCKPLGAKFGGMTEEEVRKLLLPDHMGPGLDIIFVRRTIYKSIPSDHLPVIHWCGVCSNASVHAAVNS